jgi:hypothetical protein
VLEAPAPVIGLSTECDSSSQGNGERKGKREGFSGTSFAENCNKAVGRSLLEEIGGLDIFLDFGIPDSVFF